MRSSKFDSSKSLAVLSFITLAVAGAFLSGCNTTEGVGEDIEAVGDSIDDAASDAND